MSNFVGTVVRGLKAPIFKKQDDVVSIVTDVLLNASKQEGLEINDHDIIGITEAVVARSQGNYATTDQIAQDVSSKFGNHTIGVVFPILSRNRFSMLLKGIAKAATKVVLLLSYPSDEVGNHLISLDALDEQGINPYSDVLTLKQYRELFGYPVHEFTGVDYVAYYHDLIEQQGADCEIIFANDPRKVLNYTQHVLCCDIHTRHRSKRLLKQANAELVLGLDDILNQSVDGSGYNPDYGLLGSNLATDNSVKLFPRDGQPIVEAIQEHIFDKTGKLIEVLIYGDGAFKDPQGKIWELADPVVSPAFTKGLVGQPNELKLKYLADNEFSELTGDTLRQAIVQRIKDKQEASANQQTRLGTTPRQLTDLIGSLCDLTSGSGDKGTPIVYIQGYFDNFAK